MHIWLIQALIFTCLHWLYAHSASSLSVHMLYRVSKCWLPTGNLYNWGDRSIWLIVQQALLHYCCWTHQLICWAVIKLEWPSPVRSMPPWKRNKSKHRMTLSENVSRKFEYGNRIGDSQGLTVKHLQPEARIHDEGHLAVIASAIGRHCYRRRGWLPMSKKDDKKKTLSPLQGEDNKAKGPLIAFD